MKMSEKKVLLIVEDESSARKAILEKFTREGFGVAMAFNGEDGLDQAEKIRPDLILLDVIMPKIDGITFLEKLRVSSAWGKQVPVIVLTNITLEGDEKKQKLKDLEIKDYMIKADCKISDVVERVKKELCIE